MQHPNSVRALFPRAALCLAAAGVAALLLAAWVILAGDNLVQAGRQGRQQATLAAQGVASSLDAALAAFTLQLQAVRPETLTSNDRLRQTTWLLRLQTLLPAATTFMLSADGHLLAASVPFAQQDAAVGDAAWFQAAAATPDDRLGLQRLAAPWLGVNSGVVLTREVTDTSGKVAGLVGAVLPRAALQQLVPLGRLAPQISLALTGAGGTTLWSPAAGAAAPPAAPPTWEQDVALSLLGWLGQPASWSGTAPLHAVAATAVAGLPPSVALPRGVVEVPAIAGGILLTVGLAFAGLLAFGRRGPQQPGTAPTGFGADWQCALDTGGSVVACFGNAPEGLRHRLRQPLPVVLGLEADSAAVVAAALSRRMPEDDLRVAGSGRAWRLSLRPEGEGFVCTGRDITAEAAAQASREAAESALTDTRRNQDRLLTSLGHDIRTPMASIMGTCELLLDGTLEEEQREWLERVQGSCGALLGMLNGLLAAGEDETARGALVCEPVDVSALVQEVVDVLRPQARDKALELRIRCDDLLRGQWLVDPSRLRQVVFNLASNAVKYTAGGRVEIHASAVEADGHSRLRIAVADTGPGIDPAERGEIFERFRRGRAHEGAAQGGLGLGLALCRENARLMGGSITLESALGVGSEFTFECPADRVPVQNRLMPFAGRTALIVADDGPATRVLAGQLAELGLTVETAPDGYLGLALAERLEAQRGAVDLVALQGNLPGMPGDAFVIRLRRTAFGRRAALVWIGEGAETAEVDAVVPAPPDPYQVAAVARQLLALRPSFEALAPNAAMLRGGRILLVDDDKANRTLLTAALSRRGFAVFTAGDGEEALRLAGRDSFDAVLMDLQMPGMDGFETARRMRALPGRTATVPILALTALQGARLRQRCEEAGFVSVMEKPVNLERLTAWLHQTCGGTLPADGNAVDYTADVSLAYLEEMVAVVGIERARACVAEFIADARARCLRLNELLPGWEVEAILRCCEAISGRAETCGAFALSELLEEIADAASRDDRETVGTLVARLDALVARLPAAMATCLDDIDRRWRRGNKAA